jgi:GDPmannose 4,6-dehydratase
MKTALITGVTGQDGAYLAKLLLQNGYTVYGTHRTNSTPNSWRLEYLGILGHPHFHLYGCELTDFDGCKTLIKQVNPDEIYNLAAQSFVGLSFQEPFMTAQITGVAVLNLLEAIRIIKPTIRFYQASSSELFGKVEEIPQTEKTVFHPCSPYAVAKLFAHWSTINYRESYGLFATCGILYNHESPLRSKEFVTRKITHTVAQIALGYQKLLILGNLDVSRDWGYAKEYVVGMHSMMQQEFADTFILATNRTATVREFTDLSFQAANIDLIWEGTGLNTYAVDRKSGQFRVRVDQQFYRPCEVGMMQGDASKARELLGWQANTRLEQLCLLMVQEDLRRVQHGFML